MSMRRYIAFSLFLLLLLPVKPATVLSGETAEETVNARILKILIDKGIISKDQYLELLAQARKEEEARKSKVIVSFKKGLSIRTADNRNRIRFDGRFQGDFKAYSGGHPDHSSFFVRRARLCASGTLSEYYDFRVEPEFGKGGSRLNDGFMNIHYWPFAQLKFGQFKTPFSMEELHSDNWIDFVERSLANKIAPSRDLGLMFHGAAGNDFLYYQAGVFNGYKLNQTGDPDGGKDLAARLVIAPFNGSSWKPARGLRLGGAITYGSVDLTESQWWNSGDFKTAAGTTYLGFSSGVVQDGHRTRGGVELAWDWGSNTIKAEYMKVRLNGLRKGSMDRDHGIQGGYVYFSRFLTGERFSYKKGRPGRVVPNRTFSLHDAETGWGALQVGIRLEFLKADQGLLNEEFVDASRYTDKAQAYTLGFNWYPNEMVRFMVNGIHTVFDDKILVSGERIDHENLVLTRCQVVF